MRGLICITGIHSVGREDQPQAIIIRMVLSPRRLFATATPFLFLTAALVACSSGSDSRSPPDTPTRPASTATAPAETPPAPSPSATMTPTPTMPPAATATPRHVQLEPAGFPIAPGTRLGVVTGEVGSRSIDWDAGATAEEYSRDLQPSEDEEVANSMGWNCRLHVEYEGVPAVDWYVPIGTPVFATMDGTATLYIVSLPNAFDHYGVDREPYLGNPERSRAPLSPFPGPGGGKGVFVEVTNESFATEYAHFELLPALEAVPDGAFIDDYSHDYNYTAAFSDMRPFNRATAIATWQIRVGDLLGYSGDTGYSEAPHLHYTVRRAGGSLLCPTLESGFADGGWLFRTMP